MAVGSVADEIMPESARIRVNWKRFCANPCSRNVIA
jgi:hypothetical protein